jgi:hypothetical protein
MTDRWSTYAFGIDISGIQKVVDYKMLAPYVDFYIARVGHGGWTYRNVTDPAVAIDTTFATHCQGAYDTGKVFGAYWVFDPTVIPDPKQPLKDRQIAPLVYALGSKIGKSVDFLALDVEIWQTADGAIPPTQIADNFELLIGRLHNIWPDLKIGVYTADWFFEHSPTMKVKIDNLLKQPWFFTWGARYPSDPDWVGNGVQKASWSDFRGKFAPELDATKSFPWLSNGAMTIWQYSGDKYTADGHYGEVKGAYSAMDLNYFNGTLAQMKSWCGNARMTPEQIASDATTTPTTPSTPTAPYNVFTDTEITALKAIASHWKG